MGNDRLLIETAAGQQITIQGDDQGVVIQDASGDSIQLQAGNMQIRASGKVSVACSEMEINASTITVNAPMTKFSGTVQADTVIANSVVASSYTPGAGNVW
jgi:phage gp45-like